MDYRPKKTILKLITFFGLGVFLSFPAQAIKRSYVTTQYHHFPQTPFVQKQIRFWELVFGKYPSTSVLIHDQDHPELIIDLIDYKEFKKKHGARVIYSRKYRDAITERYLKRYELGIQRFKSKKSQAVAFGAIEQRIYDVYKKNPRALRELYQGQVSIRSQAGLADEFIVASKRSFQYLPYMEKLFAQKGLPTDLTRLAFVESMFNIHARSKVGASGIWQFMPATARDFMRVDKYFDERNSPLKATEGAARLLKQNFSLLGSWPLAITAYNHGPGGMKKAVRKLKTKDFDQIIAHYKAKSFGFASKNFYSEFIAARNTYNKFFKQKRAGNPFTPHVVPIEFSSPMSITQILEHTPLNKKTLLNHNPCLLQSAFIRYKHAPLPKDYTLFIPTNLANSVKDAIERLRTKKYRRS